MKFIDEKGRLFGKINIIDFSAILFLICLIPTFYFWYRISSKRERIIKGSMELAQIEINCKFIKVEPNILKMISVGDKEVDEKGAVIGEIIWLGEIKPYQYEFDIGGGRKITKTDPNLKAIFAKFKLQAQIKDNAIYYKEKPITINSQFDFKTDKYKLESTLITLEEKIEIGEMKRIECNATLKNLTEDMLKLISVGDKEIDGNGNVIAEILRLGKIENNTYEINLGGGNFALGEDNKKQIYLKMALQCNIDNNGQMYFKGERVTDDSWIEFKTDKYIAKGKIAKSYEATPTALNEKWIQVKVKFSGIIPELAKIVTLGDTEQAPNNKVMGRLKTIISNNPSDVLIIRENKFTTISHPFQRDIVTILDLLCIEKEGILYFKNYPVKMGNLITFTSDLYSLSGEIIGLETK